MIAGLKPYAAYTVSRELAEEFGQAFTEIALERVEATGLEPQWRKRSRLQPKGLACDNCV